MLTDHLPACYNDKVRILSAYNETIATAIRTGAPLVTFAIERRCIENYMAATKEQKIQAPICLTCGCKYPFVESRNVNRFSWVKPFNASQTEKGCIASFLVLNKTETKHALGWTVFIRLRIHKT